MSTVNFKGQPVSLAGQFPQEGQLAPDFIVVDNHLNEVKLSDYRGKTVILNIFPSIDTPVCAAQLRTFSSHLSENDDVALIFVSMDLPFAFARFCAVDDIQNAVTTSDFRYAKVGKDYGVEMLDGPLAGLYARAVLVIDTEGVIQHAELVSDVTDEPIYEQSLLALDPVLA